MQELSQIRHPSEGQKTLKNIASMWDPQSKKLMLGEQLSDYRYDKITIKVPMVDVGITLFV